MRVSSRRILPPSHPPMTQGGWLLLGSLLATLASFATMQPKILLLFSGIAAVITALTVRDRLRLRALAASRPGESICTFARSFDCRAIDTRIIRAAHEELQPYYNGFCPIRASDRLSGEMFIDEEEMDDVAIEIARRTGRSMDRWEENPLVGRVETVADLVHFLAYQPLVA